ncbi:hypothetical protein L6452_17039 [Arctium lappa]|uniref:Uncharacterized protein n=1 Tax=Arctium lappa TaxID=4217 RepID=A0ACB9C284_ARCLA|nr:hypothetical protein L6452_17039 [Arctium lappa]
MLQTTVIDMEWNTKWDWENLDLFGSKGVASPKKLQSADWGIKEGEDIDVSFNLSGIVGGSGGSASDVGNNSSAKSSISASTESSFKDGMKVSNFPFEVAGGFPDAFSKEFAGGELNGTSPSFEASVCSSDQSIGLKLGKRTYFENSFARSNTKTCSSPNIPVSSVSTVKKLKLSCQSTPVPRCQVEGCNLDLSSAKEYHRKHRVCESHSKSLKVVVGGLDRRFCQQCSRFHSLSEFDGKKRSCRRRLSDHNARRRKPQQETIQFNSTSPSSSFYDGQQQLSFVFNNVPLVQTKPGGSSIWESTCNSKPLVATVKAEKPGGHDGLTHSVGQFPNDVNMPSLAINGIMPSKGATASIFDQVESVDVGRALSLLSNNWWGSLSEPDLMHTTNMGLPFEYWQQVDQESPHHILKPWNGIQYGNPMDEILKPL